jgi:hypothetical protein
MALESAIKTTMNIDVKGKRPTKLSPTTVARNTVAPCPSIDPQRNAGVIALLIKVVLRGRP